MLLLAAALLAAPQPTGDMPVINPNGPFSRICPATSRYEAAKRGKNPKAQKLNELSDADFYRAVYRRIGQCEAPIIVKFGVVGR